MNNEFNIYKKVCPSRQVLNDLTTKWSFLILSLLLKKEYRFNELKHNIEGINETMLSKTLHLLEMYGLISRTVISTIPPKVSYKITNLGLNIGSNLIRLTESIINNLEEITKNEKDYLNTHKQQTE